MDSERRRLARELHDGVAQELAFIRRRAGRLSETTDGVEIVDAADRALEDSRRAIEALVPPAHEPLAVALERLGARLAGECGVEVQVNVRIAIEVADEVRAELIRIISEAVRNAAHHGGARHVRVDLAGSPLAVRIIDDGCGFRDGANSGLGVAGYGLIAMRERAELVGGQVQPRIRPRRRYPRPGGAAIDQVRVLVADDHAPTREDIATALTDGRRLHDHRHGGGCAGRGRRGAARAARSRAAGRQHARQRTRRGLGDHRAAARRRGS